MGLRTFILNRFTLTFVGIAVAIAAWNLFVVLNDDGELQGLIVDGQGQPVAGASVEVWRKAITGVEIVTSTETNADGRFELAPHNQYALYVKARKDDVGEAESDLLRLSFRNQNYELAEPLVLE